MICIISFVVFNGVEDESKTPGFSLSTNSSPCTKAAKAFGGQKMERLREGDENE